MQSCNNYTPWVDSYNSQGIQEKYSAKHIVWHWEILGIDNRYAFNDEPETIYQIFQNYKPVKSDDLYTVLDRAAMPLLGDPKDLFSANYSLGKWIDVPEGNNELIRGKALIKRKLLGKIKRAIYKEDLFPLRIDLKMEPIYCSGLSRMRLWEASG